VKNKNKVPLHRLISAGKSKGHISRELIDGEFIQVQVSAHIKGLRKIANSIVRLPLESGATVAVFNGMKVEISESVVGRRIVNVRGNRDQLLASKAIKSINRSGNTGRVREPIRVSLSPNLIWCGYCGPVEKGHVCASKSDE